MEVLSEKGVSVIGLSMESLVGALARGCSGGRCAVAVLPLRSSALALRLAESGRGLYRAQPVILPGRNLKSVVGFVVLYSCDFDNTG